MKIPEVKSISTQAAKKAKKADSTTASSFSDHLAPTNEAAPDNVAADEVAPVSAISSILSIQEVGEKSQSGQNERQMIRWGENILDQLDQVRHDLLMGGIPVERLTTLAQSLRERKSNVSDPSLLALMDEIEIRAEVEIAKYSRGLDK